MRRLSELRRFLHLNDEQIARYERQNGSGPSEWGWNAEWDADVKGLVACADQVSEQGGFVALPGQRHHGADFMDQALAKGACLIITDELGRGKIDQAWLHAPGTMPLTVMVWPDLTDPARQAALASWFHHAPSNALQLLGVTGTNGKSSVAHFTAQYLSWEKGPVGMLGTLGAGLWTDGHWAGAPVRNTTPDTFELNSILADWRDQGVSVAVMEVSSHAIELGRIDGLRFHALALTNVTRDHLDFHGSLAAYQATKKKLFTDWPAAFWVANLDDAVGQSLATIAEERCESLAWIGYGREPMCDRAQICLKSARATQAGWQVLLAMQAGDQTLAFNLMGAFQLDNVMCALGLAQSVGQRLLPERVKQLSGVTGRMQPVSLPQGMTGPVGLVDYAHTPDGLSAALMGARAHLPEDGNLWCVFGCGGNRDVGKRPDMGRVAARQADRVIVTDDNPRDEAPEAIVADILEGVRGWDGQVDVIHDRQSAIETAVLEAGVQDIVLVAGKGHETTQTIGLKQLSFFDPDAVRMAYQRRLQGNKSVDA
ncbi:UDP-N-acetylmuramoyl-L-alanyl-D-glutamate--2,6-diaminopimelate ligase [Thiomicrospira sp. WB1]|uniref:UDP-N-acetylmuramoyl-L-alanyl-D-glutamate--2, 6-diaminopimelate ligase n=1 Tax=Thiomicrospira sp. WB1 TaxID=1685380 RepID=UPI000746E359|nr:UDP-N-acetylmuramoyl-L-alanyl-D-glutamate--2,6-diaminopimelate ligase [Thiomicrospira sp. WB1]KUJ71380.1 hypothetical protein AVO41_07565 [Thiomicrospira sp. WB1]